MFHLDFVFEERSVTKSQICHIGWCGQEKSCVFNTLACTWFLRTSTVANLFLFLHQSTAEQDWLVWLSCVWIPALSFYNLQI